MTLEEIYAKMAHHMIKGMMIHEQLANYYDFLGLDGYKKCHEHRFLEESCNFCKLNHYFITHNHKLIEEIPVEPPKVIPESWFKYTRDDVDVTTRKNAVKNGIVMWVDWEKVVKNDFESLYTECVSLGDISNACQIKCFIKEVDEELCIAEKTMLELKSIDFNMDYIISIQQKLHDKYAKKEKDR